MTLTDIRIKVSETIDSEHDELSEEEMDKIIEAVHSLDFSAMIKQKVDEIRSGLSKQIGIEILF